MVPFIFIRRTTSLWKGNDKYAAIAEHKWENHTLFTGGDIVTGAWQMTQLQEAQAKKAKYIQMTLLKVWYTSTKIAIVTESFHACQSDNEPVDHSWDVGLYSIASLGITTSGMVIFLE